MFFSDDFVIPHVDRPAKLMFRNGIVMPNNRVSRRSEVSQPAASAGTGKTRQRSLPVETLATMSAVTSNGYGRVGRER